MTTKTHASASISLPSAIALIDASLAACKKIGIEAAIAVTDAGGHLLAFQRTDDSLFLTAEIAVSKAWTAVSFGLATHVWNSLVSEHSQIAPLTHHPRVMAGGGGYPIKLGGKLVGGIGISGGNYAQDQEAAEVALKQLGFELA
jgi:uncharacterized protein GlcG (DUF336 family)